MINGNTEEGRKETGMIVLSFHGNVGILLLNTAVINTS